MLKQLKYSTLGVLVMSAILFFVQFMAAVNFGSSKILDSIMKLSIFLPEQFKVIYDQVFNVLTNFKVTFLVLMTLLLVSLVLFVFIISIVNLILIVKQENKGITLAKMATIILFDLLAINYVSGITGNFLVSGISNIHYAGLILSIILFAHALFSATILIQYIVENRHTEAFSKQLASIYKFSYKLIAIVLIFFFTQKIIAVLAINVLIDTLINNIDVGMFLNGALSRAIDYSRPISDFVPPNLEGLLIMFGVPITSSLSTLGITSDVVDKLISVGVSPINESIHHSLNVFTNSIIFRNFPTFIIGIAASISLLIFNSSNMIKGLYKNVVLVILEIILLVILLNGFTIGFINSTLVFFLVILIILEAYKIFKEYQKILDQKLITHNEDAVIVDDETVASHDNVVDAEVVNDVEASEDIDSEAPVEGDEVLEDIEEVATEDETKA